MVRSPGPTGRRPRPPPAGRPARDERAAGGQVAAHLPTAVCRADGEAGGGELRHGEGHPAHQLRARHRVTGHRPECEVTGPGRAAVEAQPPPPRIRHPRDGRGRRRFGGRSGRDSALGTTQPRPHSSRRLVDGRELHRRHGLRRGRRLHHGCGLRRSRGLHHRSRLRRLPHPLLLRGGPRVPPLPLLDRRGIGPGEALSDRPAHGLVGHVRHRAPARQLHRLHRSGGGSRLQDIVDRREEVSQIGTHRPDPARRGPARRTAGRAAHAGRPGASRPAHPRPDTSSGTP